MNSVPLPVPLPASLLGNGPVARADAPFGLFEVRGPDAADFLHRLCTQDVVGLADGEARPAAFLNSKGRLLATCLVFRLGGSLWLETQAQQVEGLRQLLDRYHFTEKLTIGPPVAAPCREHIAAADGLVGSGRAMQVGDATRIEFARRGVAFTRVHGGGEPAPAAPLGPELAECLRMVAGLVRVGLETEPSTLALEADLDDHCSTTKGCYTGQEIIARIHTYGHVNRKLCLLQLAPGPAITAPEPLHEPEERLAVGRVMHAVPLPSTEAVGDAGGRLGLGYLPTDFQALGTRLALANGAAVTVVGFQPLPA